jgi:hypothetical protein
MLFGQAHRAKAQLSLAISGRVAASLLTLLRLGLLLLRVDGLKPFAGLVGAEFRPHLHPGAERAHHREAALRQGAAQALHELRPPHLSGRIGGGASGRIRGRAGTRGAAQAGSGSSRGGAITAGVIGFAPCLRTIATAVIRLTG